MRGIAYGLAALRFHGIGIPALENHPLAGDVMSYLREVDCPITLRRLQRKVHRLTAGKRDELIATLRDADLVTTHGKEVETVRLADYLSGIPARERFPAITLLSGRPSMGESSGKPSAA